MIWKCWYREGYLGKNRWGMGQLLLEDVTLAYPIFVPSCSLTLWGLYLTCGSCG